MTTPPVYDAFLSYNSLDHVIVERVTKELAARQCRCFIDRWYLQPGRDWIEALERALSSSRSLAIFIGPHGMGRWQQRERAWGQNREVEVETYSFIPVLLPGCEPPLGFMKNFMWIDLRDNPADSGQLDALAAAIRGETVNLEGRREPRAMICPYRGLLAFREEDAELFRGRDSYRAELVSLVQEKEKPLVAVVGASGSGKSSLVSAGLVPELRKLSDGPVWDVVRMVPTEDPLYSLAKALVPLIEPNLSGLDLEEKLGRLARDLEKEEPTVPLWGLANAVLRQQPGTERVLLFVDQWEELYTNCEKVKRRERFIEELLEATSRKDSPLRVVLTVRGDFYKEILHDRPLLDRIHDARLDLGPMNQEELRDAIEGPAKKVKLSFQDGLVQRILKDARREPGRLPLLEFALKELWNCRDHTQLTHAGYEDLGRPQGHSVQNDTSADTDCLGGAIAVYADRVYDKLSKDEHDVLPSLFRKLVRAGSESEEDTRQRVLLSDLSARSQGVARKLADKRLLVTTMSVFAEQSRDKRESSLAKEPSDNDDVRDISDPPSATVEVAHEELLRRWWRLKEWVDQDRKFLQWKTRLDLKVDEFQRDGASALFRDKGLQDANEFYPARQEDLGDDQRGFLEASFAAERERREAEHERQEAERKRREAEQRLRTGIRRAVVAMIVAGVFAASWINDSRHRANAVVLLERYLDAPEESVADDFEDLVKPYRTYLLDPLHKAFTVGERTHLENLNAAYALARLDDIHPEELRILLQPIPGAELKHRERNFDLALRAISNKELLKEQLIDLAKQSPTTGSYRYGLTGLAHGFKQPLTICTQLDADPTDRTELIHRWEEWPADIDTVIGLLQDTETDDGLRSALCCVIGLRCEDEAWVKNRDRLIPLLNDAYTTAEEPGLHFTAEWVLRKWNAMPENKTESRAGKWETNSQKMTMILIPAGKFMMGTDGHSADESPRREVELQNGFYLSNREVSVEQFMRFVNDPDYTGPQLVDWEGYNKNYSPDVHCPVQKVSWLDAVRYCNWLSQEEGLKIAYDEQDWKPIPGANGYRLPTEEQWEYACRAGSDTKYSFGDNGVAASDYAVFGEQTTQPCGSRIPNAWGLFDMHGNVWEWCEDSYRESYKKDAVITETSRVLRGCSFYYLDPLYLRSADRVHYTPDVRYNDLGFRLSRTP